MSTSGEPSPDTEKFKAVMLYSLAGTLYDRNMGYDFVESAATAWPAPLFHEIAGFRTAVYQEGRGPTVVLFHGCSLCVDARLTWFRLLPTLARVHHVML